MSEVKKRQRGMSRYKTISVCPICGNSRYIQSHHKDRLNGKCPKCARIKLEYRIPKESYEPNNKIMGGLIGKQNQLYIYRKCVDCGKEQWRKYRNLIGVYRCRSCTVSHTWITRIRKHNYNPNGEPKLGEIRYGKDTDKSCQNHSYIWAKCPDCNYIRWVLYYPKKKQTELILCIHCSIKKRIEAKTGLWKGGRFKNTSGYVWVRVRDDNFFSPMARKSGYVMEHRLIMAKQLSRCLLPWEIVHHINGIRHDNRLENLQLLPNRQYHIPDTLSKSLWKRILSRFDYLENLLAENNVRFKPNNIIYNHLNNYSPVTNKDVPSML